MIRPTNQFPDEHLDPVCIYSIICSVFYLPIINSYNLFSFAGDFKVFEKLPIHLMKVDQINALASHDGGSVLIGQADHPRAARHLLGYLNTKSSFIKRRKDKSEDGETVVRNTWIGQKLTFAEKDALFSKYKIVNTNFEREGLRTKQRQEGWPTTLLGCSRRGFWLCF